MARIIPICIIGFALGVLVWCWRVTPFVLASPQPVVAETSLNADFQPQNEREQWALAILDGVGNEKPSREIVDFIVAWTLAEDSGNGALNRNNPLNTTQDGFNVVASINGDGVKGYATFGDGLGATLKTLSYGFYTEVVAGLQTNDTQRAFNGLIASPWASNHYNGGAGWPVVR